MAYTCSVHCLSDRERVVLENSSGRIYSLTQETWAILTVITTYINSCNIKFNFAQFLIHVDPERNAAEQLITNIRIAYGVGIALRLGEMARIEVNYCFPYAYDRADRLHPGIQFGIGMQFL